MLTINLREDDSLIHVHAQIVSHRGRPVDAGTCEVMLRYIHDHPRTHPYKGPVNARFELGPASALRKQWGSLVLSSDLHGETAHVRLEWKCNDVVLLSHVYQLVGDGVVVVQDEFEYA